MRPHFKTSGPASPPGVEARPEDHSALTDSTLLQEHDEGKSGAFSTFVLRHQVALYNYAHYRLNSALAADEVAEEVLVQVALQARKLSQVEDLEVYLYTEARSICGAHRDSPVPPATDPSAEAIHWLVARLPVEEKDVFLLREVADLSFRQIALVMGQREGAVKLHLQNAFRRLQATLSHRSEYKQVVQGFISQ